VARPNQTADKVTQAVHFIGQTEKQGLLMELLKEHKEELTLVFARTKHGAERLMKNLDRAGFAAGSIHGNKSQGQRDRAIKSFKSGEIKVLVATDVAARGIDIDGVGYVYNFDMPNVAENYVHRIGRTARAGRSGKAIAFCAPAEMGELKAIEKIVKEPITVASGSPWQIAGEKAKPARNQQRRRRPAGGGGGQGGQRRRAA
jgi:ATP-dependent RNA helicase RhlE